MKEMELEMKEKKLQVAENELEMKEMELEIKIAKLEKTLSEAGNEAHKWEAMHGEEFEIKNKLEAEKTDMIRVEAMHVLQNNQLKGEVSELQAKLVDMSNSSETDTKGKSPIERELPSFSIRLAQLDFSVDDCTKNTPISTKHGVCIAIVPVASKKNLCNAITTVQYDEI